MPWLDLRASRCAVQESRERILVGIGRFVKKYLSRATELEYLHCYAKCFDSLSEARDAFVLHRYNDCISMLYDALEFLWKTLRHLQCHDIQGLRQHMPTKKNWNSFMPRLIGSLITKVEYQVLERLFGKYNPNWKANPPDRSSARYASRLFGEARAKQQLGDVECIIAPILARAHRRIHLQQGKLTIGILDGYFGLDRHAEKPCVERPWANYERGGITGWQNALATSLAPNAAVQLIAVNEISPRFTMVINPFGEAYPELPSAPNVTPGYQKIKDYIYAGGVFVTAGGHPLFYFWQCGEGKQEATSKVIPNVLIPVRRIPDEHGNLVTAYQMTALIPDTFLDRDFGVGTTMTLKKEHMRDCPVKAFQQIEDKLYWDCQVDVSQIRLFRALYPPAGGNPIPVLRATVAQEEVFPIAFIRYGFGMLFHVGLALNEGSEKEFNVATAAVRDGLVENFEKYF